MTARGGLGKAFAAAVGEWAAASERVVRPPSKPAVDAAEPPVPAAESTGRISGVLDGPGESGSAVRP